jgi:rod shape-determining protein MreC
MRFQFQAYRQRNPLVLAAFLVFLAIILSVRLFFGGAQARTVLQTITYPNQIVVLTIWRGVIGFPGTVAGLANLSRQNSQYQQELKRLKAELLVLEQLRKENEQLKAALGYSQGSSYRYQLLSAQVIGRSSAPWFSLVELNRGAVNGVKKGRPVITPQGVAGQVIEVSPLSCQVRLIIDAASAVSAVNSRSRNLGVLSGSSTNKLSLKYVAADGDVQVGDKITTAAISLVYPPGLILGTVTKAVKKEHDLFYQVEVKPAVEFGRLEQVFILL